MFCAQNDEWKNITYLWTEQMINFSSKFPTEREEIEFVTKTLLPTIHQLNVLTHLQVLCGTELPNRKQGVSFLIPPRVSVHLQAKYPITDSPLMFQGRSVKM